MKKQSKRCGRPCTIYSRVCGFYTPINQWNLGKEEEFKDRKAYKINNSKDIFKSIDNLDS